MYVHLLVFASAKQSVRLTSLLRSSFLTFDNLESGLSWIFAVRLRHVLITFVFLPHQIPSTDCTGLIEQVLLLRELCCGQVMCFIPSQFV